MYDERMLQQLGLSRQALMSNPGAELSKLRMLLPLTKFLEFLSPNIDENEAISRYSEYKELYYRNSTLLFFEERKDDDWFKAKYHPKLKSLRLEAFKKEVNGNWETFVADLQTGVFDSLSLDQPKETNNEGVDEMDFTTAADEEEENRISMQNSVSLGNLPESLQKAAIPNHANNTLLIKTLPPKISREEIFAVCSKIPGFVSLAFGEPNQMKNFYRVVWVRLEDGTDARDAADILESTPVSDFRLHVGMPRTNSDSRIKFCPMEFGQEDRLRRDLKAIKKMAEKMEARYSCSSPFDINEEWRTMYLQVDPEMESIDRVKKALDLYITYMRKVYYVCYYSGAMEFDNLESLVRKSGHLMLRKSEETRGPPAFLENLLKELESNIELFLRPDLTESEIQASFGFIFKAEDGEVAINESLKSKIVMEKEEKYRCTLCSKLFKGEEFVFKHLKLKHEDVVASLKDVLEAKLNYLKDPKRPSFPLVPASLDQIPPILYASNQGGLKVRVGVNNVGGDHRNGYYNNGGPRQQQQQQYRDNNNNYRNNDRGGDHQNWSKRGHQQNRSHPYSRSDSSRNRDDPDAHRSGGGNKANGAADQSFRGRNRSMPVYDDLDTPSGEAGNDVEISYK